MFTHALNPVLFDFGIIEIRWYGLVWVLGFLLAWYVLEKKKESLRIEKKDVDNFLVVLMVAVVIGSRIFHVLFWNPSYYFSNPAQILAVWQGGLAFHGGLVGAILAVWWFGKKHKIPLLKLADILSIPAVFALALGRIANFINAELVGYKTTVSWCVDFGDGCRHPVQLYAALGRFLSFALLWWFDSKEHKDGQIFWWFLILMGATRIVVDFWRVDALYFFLTAGQWFSIVMVVVGVIALWKSLNTSNQSSPS